MKTLNHSFNVDVDVVHASQWHETVARFADASLYQLWHEESSHARFSNVSRLLVKRREELVAACEVRLFEVPVVKGGIAYVFWGPLWKPLNAEPDVEVFRQAIRALVNEYVGRRGMVLRLNPRLLEAEDQALLEVLSQEGFSGLGGGAKRQSLIIDLSPSLDELRAGLDKKWRNSLSKSERSELTIVSGVSLALFDEFAGVYSQMLERKQFAPTADIQKHRRLQQVLPEPLKMGVVVARHAGETCAGAIFSAVGDTGIYVFGATNETGMRTSASHLVQWEVLRLLKDSGIRYYDLNGINPESNPGTSHFKKGLAGKNGREVTFTGQSQVLQGSLANYSVLLVDKWRAGRQAARNRGPQATA